MSGFQQGQRSEARLADCVVPAGHRLGDPGDAPQLPTSTWLADTATTVAANRLLG